ncbi:BTB/POZ domain-containing protein At1g67900 [Typha angustifolia]|uniref:BTB/POZ domain-containing protein At1g67900 n=1 Tax=Typha angustifolia TaxID=59011 RepID=UPI003C30925D
MKFMKLGTRPDIFFTSESVRTISSEVSTDLRIEVDNSLYHLHKFPLLSKCLRLQTLCNESADTSEAATIKLPAFPGGAEAFEICAKFCYGITITLSALNFIPARCAAEYLQMTDDADRSNLVGKLDSFFKSCILRRWKDTVLTLQCTRQYAALCKELGMTGRCIDAVTAMIVNHPAKANCYHRGWWAEDISELEIDLYWRVMVAVKSAGIVSEKTIGEALQVYAVKWLPNMASEEGHQSEEEVAEATLKHRLLLEKIVSLIPIQRGSVTCSFLLRLLKAANILSASMSTKMELVRKIGVQLEEATLSDLLIPSLAYGNDDVIYDVDIVMNILEEFMLQGQSPPTSPPREKFMSERRRSRSAENVEFLAQENSRRSSSSSHSSKLRVAKLIDGYLQVIARDKNLPMEKVIALAEAIPDFARPDHDDLYKVIDAYFRAHPEMDKNARKQLCRILDCKRLSVEACVHAAQNELLPLRVVVQVLFFEQARAAMSGSQMSDLPTGIKALIAKSAIGDEQKDASKISNFGNATSLDDQWSISGLKYSKSKIATLKMKLAEDEDIDDDFIPRESLMRSTSSRFKALCSIPSKPKRMLSKLWPMNRSISERH